MTIHLAFLGAGAVGGFVGGGLAGAGHDVTLIDAWPEHVAAIRRDGLRVTTPEGSRVVRARALHVHEVQDLRRHPVDIAVIATKSYDTEWATMLIRPYLAPAGYVVSLQNCINEERIAGIVGWGRTVGCVAHTISVRVEGPGHVARTRKAGGAARHVFSVGEIHGRITPRAEQLAGILAAVDGATVTNNLWGLRWSKLTLNAMHNGLCGITGLNHHGVAERIGPRRISIGLGGEAIAVGRALGYDIGPIRKQDPEVWLAAARGDRTALAVIEKVIGDEVKNMTDDGRPSTAQDMLKGRRTEIDAINGHVAAKGRESGIPTPLQDAIVDLAHRVESGELAPGEACLQELARQVGAG